MLSVEAINRIIIKNYETTVLETLKLIKCDIDINKIFWDKTRYARWRKFYLYNATYQKPYTHGVLINEINKWYLFYSELDIQEKELISIIYDVSLDLMKDFNPIRVYSKDSKSRKRIVGGRPSSYLKNKLPIKVKKKLLNEFTTKKYIIDNNNENINNNVHTFIDKIIDLKRDSEVLLVFISLVEGSSAAEIKKHFGFSKKKTYKIINYIKGVFNDN